MLPNLISEFQKAIFSNGVKELVARRVFFGSKNATFDLWYVRPKRPCPPRFWAERGRHNRAIKCKVWDKKSGNTFLIERLQISFNLTVHFFEGR